MLDIDAAVRFVMRCDGYDCCCCCAREGRYKRGGRLGLGKAFIFSRIIGDSKVKMNGDGHEGAADEQGLALCSVSKVRPGESG